MGIKYMIGKFSESILYANVLDEKDRFLNVIYSTGGSFTKYKGDEISLRDSMGLTIVFMPIEDVEVEPKCREEFKYLFKGA